jgi:hypothetical protein
MTLKGRTARPKRELLAANQGGGMIHTVVLKSPAGTPWQASAPRNDFGHWAMSRNNRSPLVDRVTQAADTALAAQGYVSPVEVLVGIRWIDPGTVKRWQQGQIDCLEAAMQTNPSRITEAMELFRAWAAQNQLIPSETQYVARTPQRQTLRFSRGGDPKIEAFYGTHWISPALSEKKRERLAEQANRPPDLVVVQPLKHEWKCHRCGGTGDFLVMENAGPACLHCVGLDDLEFLPRGDALLTRRVRARSARSAVVVRFSRTRERYERQGLLVEPHTLAEVQQQLEAREHG